MPLGNEDKEYKYEEEYVGAPLDSIEESSSGDKDYEFREDDREDTVLYDAEKNEEEASLVHKGESFLSESP